MIFDSTCLIESNNAWSSLCNNLIFSKILKFNFLWNFEYYANFRHGIRCNGITFVSRARDSNAFRDYKVATKNSRLWKCAKTLANFNYNLQYLRCDIRRSLYEGMTMLSAESCGLVLCQSLDSKESWETFHPSAFEL